MSVCCSSSLHPSSCSFTPLHAAIHPSFCERSNGWREVSASRGERGAERWRDRGKDRRPESRTTLRARIIFTWLHAFTVLALAFSPAPSESIHVAFVLGTHEALCLASISSCHHRFPPFFNGLFPPFLPLTLSSFHFISKPASQQPRPTSTSAVFDWTRSIRPRVVWKELDVGFVQVWLRCRSNLLLMWLSEELPFVPDIRPARQSSPWTLSVT